MLLSQEERGQPIRQEKTANVCHIDSGIVKPFKKNKVNQYLLIWSNLHAELEGSKMQKSSRVCVHLWPPKDACVHVRVCACTGMKIFARIYKKQFTGIYLCTAELGGMGLLLFSVLLNF